MPTQQSGVKRGMRADQKREQSSITLTQSHDMREAHVRPAGARGYPEEGAIHSFGQILGFCIKTRLHSRPYLLVSSDHIIADNKKSLCFRSVVSHSAALQ